VGVYGKSAHIGLYGVGSDAGVYGTGSKRGVNGYSFDDGKGVEGSSANGIGVYGTGREGGYFTTNQGGIALPGNPGVNVSTANAYNPGVSIKTAGIYSRGMVALTLGNNSEGVFALTYGNQSTGVYAVTHGYRSPGMVANTLGDQSRALVAATEGENSDSINTYSVGSGSRAIYAHSAQSDAIYAATDNPSSYGLNTPNYIYAKGSKFPSSDVAEYMPVTKNVSAGTVLIIGEDGKLQPSTTSYDTRVAGIVSTAPGVALGTKENGNPGEQIIAVAGRVPCMVDASSTPIHAGDLLTTSDTPGYAMKAARPQIGTILGKAMGTLESGTGTIEVLVTLQ
jgi:hypothetical protein